MNTEQAVEAARAEAGRIDAMLAKGMSSDIKACYLGEMAGYLAAVGALERDVPGTATHPVARLVLGAQNDRNPYPLAFVYHKGHFVVGDLGSNYSSRWFMALGRVRGWLESTYGVLTDDEITDIRNRRDRLAEWTGTSTS